MNIPFNFKKFLVFAYSGLSLLLSTSALSSDCQVQRASDVCPQAKSWLSKFRGTPALVREDPKKIDLKTYSGKRTLDALLRSIREQTEKELVEEIDLSALSQLGWTLVRRRLPELLKELQKQFPNLKNLLLKGVPVSVESTAQIFQMEKLECLDLENSGAKDQHIDLQAFLKNQSLKRINLQGTKLSVKMALNLGSTGRTLVLSKDFLENHSNDMPVVMGLSPFAIQWRERYYDKLAGDRPGIAEGKARKLLASVKVYEREDGFRFFKYLLEKKKHGFQDAWEATSYLLSSSIPGDSERAFDLAGVLLDSFPVTYPRKGILRLMALKAKTMATTEHDIDFLRFLVERALPEDGPKSKKSDKELLRMLEEYGAVKLLKEHKSTKDQKLADRLASTLKKLGQN